MAETVTKEETKTVEVTTTEKRVRLDLTLEQAACLLEYLADSGTKQLEKGGVTRENHPLESIYVELGEYARETGEIPTFMNYPAKAYGWRIFGSYASRHQLVKENFKGE